MDLILIIGFFAFMIWFAWPKRKPVPFFEAPPKLDLIEEVQAIQAATAMSKRDPLLHPMRDLQSSFPHNLFKELHPAKRTALLAYIQWWCSETMRDTCERQIVGLQTILDMPKGASEERFREALDGMLSATRSLAQICEENQRELGDPRENRLENTVS